MYFDPKSSVDFNTAEAPLNAAYTKRRFFFLLLPGVSMFDVSAAIEPLRIANKLSDKTLYAWTIISEDGKPVECSNGIKLPVEEGLPEEQVQDRVIICSGEQGYLEAQAKTLNWLRRHVRFGGSVGAVATGAFTLARAGLAAETEYTLHWSLIPVFEELFPELECQDTRIHAQKGHLSGAGGVSGLDLALSVVQTDCGYAIAQSVANDCLHNFDDNTQMSQRPPMSKRVGSRHPVLLRILKRMEETIQNPLSLDELIASEPISKRQVERLFNTILGSTPLRYYRDLRLDRARSLLQGTDMSVTEVGVATGFYSVSTFAKYYRRRYGERPADGRKKRRKVV